MGAFLLPDNFVKRTDLKMEELAVYNIPLTTVRVWDALQTLLPSTSANDDLAIAGNNYGTDAVYLATSDLKSAGATTRYCRFQFPLPPEYVAGETITIRCLAGMFVTIADTSATVDFNCYVSDNDLTVGSDLVTTSAQSINSLTLANKDFVVTPTNRIPGDILDIRLIVTVTDGGGGAAVYAMVQAIKILLDIRG